MSATGPSSPLPASAAVLEFICLFTHDLRRKQKRWQDGRLKYHSFNNRVMVYDERGNFVGDMHWHRDYDLDEGEEVELERGGVIVQVQDLVSRTQQDLSELLDKRAKEKERRQLQAAARSPAPSAALPRSMARPIPPDQFQLRHRPLHQVIGTPSGHHGRAVVSRESPYEQKRQSAASPDQRAGKKRKYENPPPSNSGYAQALFGQTLTLSAVPTSSVPDKHLSTRESDPSSSAEFTARKLREEFSPALREQPSSSRHFNQPVTRLPAVRQSKERRLVYDLEGDEDHDRSQNNHAQHQRRASPVFDDVIEIDASHPVSIPMEPARPKRAEKQRPKAARVEKQTDDRPNGTLLRQHANFSIMDSNQLEDPLNEKSSKKEERLIKLNKSKTITPNPAAKRAPAEAAVLRKKQEPQSAELMTRRPSEPVTELRIKSSKKRGLLMMSEAKKQQREQSPRRSSASRPPPRASDQDTKEGQERNIDDHVRHFSSHSQKARELGQNDKTPARRTISTELGEDDDPIRSPSPMAKHLTGPAPDLSAEDSIEDLDLTEFMQPSDIDEQGSEANFQMEDENAAADVDVESVRITTRSASPRGKVFDPYRLPSSSPDEQSELPTWMPSGPNTKSSPSKNRARNAAANAVNEVNALDNAKRKTGVKQSRKAPRNIVLEDDEELELPSVAREQADIIVDESLDTDLGDSLIPSNRENSAKASKRKTEEQGRQTGTEEEEDGVNLDAVEAVSKEQTKSKKATIASKRKPKAQKKTSDPGSEGEQPARRRKSTRKTSDRTIEPEETPLPSEQDNSEDEPTPRQSRKGKKPTALEGRPRLMKIKKNVKSRELIGFNVAALQAPRGLRGIGVPFSILSSPTEESTQKMVDNCAVADVSAAPMIQDDDIVEGVRSATSNPHEVLVEGDERAVGLNKASTRDEDKHVGPREPLGKPPVTDRHNVGYQIEHVDEPSSKEPAHSREPFLPKETHALLVPHELQSRNEEQSYSTVRGATAIAKAPQASKVKDSPLPAVSTDQSPVDIPIPALQQQASIVVKNSISAFSPVRSVLKPKTTTESASTSGVTDTSDIPSAPEKPLHALRRQTSRATDVNTENEAPQGARILETADTSCAVAATVNVLVQKQVPDIRRQPSLFTPVSKAKNDATQAETRWRQNDQVQATSEPQPLALKPISVIPQQPCDQPIMDSSEARVAAQNSDTTQTTQTDSTPAAPIQRKKPFFLQQALSITPRINNIAANWAQPGPGETKSETSRNPARITNPASRGRKAALKSDAAGPAPQRVLPPTQPPAVIPISTADLASTPLEEHPKDPERPKKKMTFPGFQSARGEGPWSREAFDLLECGRPG